MNKWITLSVALLAGCASSKVPEPIVVTEFKPIDNPILVPCRIPDIPKPVSLVATLKTTDDLYLKVKTILADRELKKAYQTKLETAQRSCNQSE